MCWVYVGTVCCYKVFMVVVQLLLLVAWEEFTVVMVWYYNLCGAKAPLHTGFFHPRISQNIHCCCIHCILYSWSIDNNFVIGFYCRCLEILCQTAYSSIANYFRSYRKNQFGINVVIQLLFISLVGDVVHLIDYIELLNLPKTCLDRKCSH